MENKIVCYRLNLEKLNYNRMMHVSVQFNGTYALDAWYEGQLQP